MNPATPDVFAEVGLPDTAFFELDDASKDRLLLAAGDHEWHGLQVATAKQIVAGRHDKAPLLVLSQDRYDHMSAVRWHDAAQVVRIDLHTGLARMQRLVPVQPDDQFDERPARAPARETADEPPPAMAAAIVREVYAIDLAKPSGRVEAGTRLAVFAFAADHRSDPILVSVEGEGGSPTPGPLTEAEARAVLDEYLARQERQPIRPTVSIPNQPVARGVSLSVPSSWKVGDPPIRIEGTAHVIPGPRQLVDARALESSPDLPRAFGRALCLVAERDTGTVRAVTLELPIHNGSSEELAQGIAIRFSLNFLELFPEGPRGSGYECYLAAANLVTGPHSLRVAR